MFWVGLSVVFHLVIILSGLLCYSKGFHKLNDAPLPFIAVDVVDMETHIPKVSASKPIQKKQPTSQAVVMPSLTQKQKTRTGDAMVLNRGNEQKKDLPTREENKQQKILSAASRPKEKTSKENKPLTPESNLSVKETLSLSEKDWIRQKIQSCWILPVGLPSTCVLDIEITLDEDGHVAGTKILPSSTVAHPQFGLLKNSALRAIYHPRCNPLQLPKTRYQAWKTFQYQFKNTDG